MTLQTLILATATLLATTHAIPMMYKISKHETECLYEKVESKEHVTLSVTILSGDTLTATASLAGPFSAVDSTVSSELYAQGQAFYKDGKAGRKGNNKGGRQLFIKYPVSYEEIFDLDDDYEDDDVIMNDDDMDWDDDDMDDGSFQDYYYEYNDDDVEFDFEEDDSMHASEIADIRARKLAHDKMTPEEQEAHKKKKREENMADAKIVFEKRKTHKIKRDAKKDEKLNQKKKREMTGKEQELENMKAGQAFQATHLITNGGWYMVCVEATYSQITVEIGLRKSSEVGVPNRKTGHLQTYERHDMIHKERKLYAEGRTETEKRKADELAAAQAAGDSNLPVPGAIEAKDLKNSMDQMQRLNRLLYSIKDMQTSERHRLSIHASLNEHNHSRMVLSSLFETVFYICVSGFQVYTIRKWFRGNAILGY